MRPRRRASAALALVAALLAFGGSAAPAVRAVGPLPECDLKNVLTVPRGYDDWSITLVDWLLRVPRNYVPPDLVPVSEAGIAGPGLIREVAIDDLRALAQAAAENGTPIEVISPYRSYREQVGSFNGWVALDGYEDAITYSQRPGHSEHQLGLTIDFKSEGGPSSLPGDWMTTPTGRWMFDNAWKYGWVLSYPRGEGGALFSEATCFHYEPWHYRYLGREIARKVHRSGLTIREYLWKHHTQLDTNLQPVATPTPTPSPSPSPTPEPSPSVTPAATTSPTPMSTTESSDSAATPSPAGESLLLEPPLIAAVAVALLLVLVPIALLARRGRVFRR